MALYTILLILLVVCVGRNLSAVEIVHLAPCEIWLLRCRCAAAPVSRSSSFVLVVLEPYFTLNLISLGCRSYWLSTAAVKNPLAANSVHLAQSSLCISPKSYPVLQVLSVVHHSCQESSSSQFSTASPAKSVYRP